MAKTLGTSSSRRCVLGGLLGALLGTVVVGPAGDTLAAAGKRHKTSSKKASQRKHDDRQPGDRKRKDRGKRGHAPPTQDRTDDPTQDVTSQEVGLATYTGCRHAGSACTKPGQCCTGKCLGSLKCSCNANNPCPQPANRCKKAVCNAKGQCVIQNKAAGAACTSDTNPCTRDVCNESGACSHPHKPDGVTCGDGKTCNGGVCTSPVVPCDAQSCAAGCCDGTTCKDGNTDGACGSGGGVCLSCDAFPNSYCETTTGTCGCDADCAAKACGDDDGCGDPCQTGSCTAGPTCQGGTCTDTRAVSVSFERYDEWVASCYVTVQVTGFAPGTYSGSVNFTQQMSEEFTIEVGAEGTGSWSSRSINTIWAEGWGSVTATVDGVPSAEEPVTCPAAAAIP